MHGRKNIKKSCFVVSGLLGFYVVSWSAEGQTRGLASFWNSLTIENEGATIFPKPSATCHSPKQTAARLRTLYYPGKMCFTLHRTENKSLFFR